MVHSAFPHQLKSLNGAKVTLSMRDATVETFANEVAKQTGLNVKFADEDVKTLTGVTLDVSNQSCFKFVNKLIKPVTIYLYS